MELEDGVPIGGIACVFLACMDVPVLPMEGNGAAHGGAAHKPDDTDCYFRYRD